MLTYLFIGIIFGFLVELAADYLKRIKGWPFPPSEDPYNMVMRILVVLLWPPGLVIFIYGFLKGYKNKK